MNDQIFECGKCGFEWKKGHSGYHHCSDLMSVKIKTLQDEIERLKRGECICTKCGLRQNINREEPTF